MRRLQRLRSRDYQSSAARHCGCSQSFNTQAQATVGGTPLTYGSSALISQNNAVVGTDSITLNDAGVYLISFNADVSAGEGLTPPTI
jgi:hypothetical protein